MKYLFRVTLFTLCILVQAGRSAIAQDSTTYQRPTEKESMEGSQHDHDKMNMAGKDEPSYQHQEKNDKPHVRTNDDSTRTRIPVSAKMAQAIQKIVESYLQIKDALVADDTKQAAISGMTLESAFKKLDAKELSPRQKIIYEDIADDGREHAEHIGANSGKLEHQREHFEMLSNDVYDLVKAFGGGQVLYKDFCPMYNDKKGAIWLSESKAIKNPYYGTQMVKCGVVKEEIK